MNKPLLMVMPSNRYTIAKPLEEKHPGRLGLLLGPSSGLTGIETGLPVALDNDRYSVWSKKKEWDEKRYLRFLKTANKVAGKTIWWAAVPDVVANPEETMIWYSKWAPIVMDIGLPPALVLQDGMTPDIVRSAPIQPVALFVGGTTRWKWSNLPMWVRSFPKHPVHVGRVNTYNGLVAAHKYGAASCDGTGWWHHKQLRQLTKYLERSDSGIPLTRRSFF